MPSKKLETYLKTINKLLKDRQKFDEITSVYYNKIFNEASTSHILQLPPELSNAIIIGSNIQEHD